jgi:outer membrane biosynthesis protein TonB
LIARIEGNKADAAKPDMHGSQSDPVKHVPASRQPRATSDARAAGDGLTIPVEVTVDETGRVILACAQSGQPTLRAPGERAAYRWRFSPTLQDGVPVKVVGTISFKFDPAMRSEKY